MQRGSAFVEAPVVRSSDCTALFLSEIHNDTKRGGDCYVHTPGNRRKSHWDRSRKGVQINEPKTNRSGQSVSGTLLHHRQLPVPEDSEKNKIEPDIQKMRCAQSLKKFHTPMSRVKCSAARRTSSAVSWKKSSERS